MTGFRLFRAWTVVLALSPILSTAAAAPPAVPVPAAALLSDPPRQSQPWTPPATILPPDFVAATKTLFRQGLADPRGGDYRDITVQVGDPIPGWTRLTQVHGWVLPHGPGDTSAFAVCWNGQVYRLLAVGAPADLKADVDAMTRSGAAPTNNLAPESEATMLWALSPLRICLLLRLGEGTLAEQVWAAQSPAARDGDPYLRLAADWTWGLLRRVLDVRRKGDDPLALFLARRLTRIRARIEGEAAERHLLHLNDPAYGPIPTSQFPLTSRFYLKFLEPLPDILADQEERVAAPKQTPALLAGEKAFPSKAAYIEALTGDLNQVNASGQGNPVPAMEYDPLGQALMSQGEDAVEPLIHVIATDTRLIRSVEIDPVQRKVYPIHAAGAAFSIVGIILKTSAFGDGPYRENDPARTATAIQQYWDKYKNMPPAERWYRTLADDQATPAQWQEAADAIVRPTNITSLGDGALTWQPTPGAVFPLRGESLRGKSDPSVSELMARRIPQIAAVDRKRPWTGVRNAHNATLLALDAARWDARAAVPALRAQADTLSGLPKTGYFSDTQIAEDEAAVTVAGVRGGDTQALSRYVAWLLTGPLPPWASVQAFEPLWRFPRDPAITAAAARLFDGAAPPWLPGQSGENSPVPGEVMKSPLLGLLAFRRRSLAALRDKTVLGTLTANGNGWWGGNLPGLNNSLSDEAVIDPLRPKTPWAREIRRCDVEAWQLSRLGGMPRFEFYWPQPKRDAAMTLAAVRLRRYGPRFEYQPSLEAFWESDARNTHAPGLSYLWDTFNAPLAHLAFPPLGHPATPAEAARGEAIFSLAGQGERRVWPLPQWPLSARWVTDRRYPQTGPVLNGKPTVAYQQDGLVWQAEEVWRKGRWQRFYGFVGPHDVACVSAEQIEFPPDNYLQWQSFSPAIDGKVSLPEDSHRLPLSQALPITVILRCRSGSEQRVPLEWLRAGPDGPALREGLTLHLSYSPSPSFPGMGGVEAEMRRVWTPLTPARTAAFAPKPAVRRLAPTQEMQVLQLDLREWYDLSRPGSYRLSFDFDREHSGFGDRRTLSLWFELTPQKSSS